MRKLSQDRLDLIDALVAECGLVGITAGLLEKDEHLTDALRAVFALKFEYVRLVFCGGTSLSKAHSLIERMSEDADIKLVLSEEARQWGASKLRRYLGDEVRQRVATTLTELGLMEEAEKAASLNGNRYIHSQWAYARAYDGASSLRPSLQLESSPPERLRWPRQHPPSDHLPTAWLAAPARPSALRQSPWPRRRPRRCCPFSAASHSTGPARCSANGTQRLCATSTTFIAFTCVTRTFSPSLRPSLLSACDGGYGGVGEAASGLRR